ncbi:MAG TPA: PilZ domain-containing protein [Candidatus Acidoferrum sp.]|nr:PilZ domain-containing protein [Candidatus Acidoferrum sp.]
MLRPPPSLDLRKHPRALLTLPVRIRWHGPLGTRLETTRTVDVSREGLMVQRAEPCENQIHVWVTFPYDPGNGGAVQPETPATVMRVEPDSRGGYRVALRLNVPRRATWPGARERRKNARLSFALPIFVRPVGTPWPDESMTRDISHSGARFETSHIYTRGEEILAQIPWGEWAKAGEVRGRVVRVEFDDRGPGRLADPNAGVSGIYTCVAVQWIDSPKSPN